MNCMVWKQTRHHLWCHTYGDDRAEIVWGITHTENQKTFPSARPTSTICCFNYQPLQLLSQKLNISKHDFLHPTPSDDCRASVWGANCTNPWLRVTSRGQSSVTATGARSQRLMTSQASTCHLWIQYCLATTLVEGRDTWPNTGSIIPNKLNYSAV